jgi:ABC-2 type transport system ATP-binding protein
VSVVVTAGLTRRFGTHTAVDDLTLTIEAGEIFGFLGHNGAGKTTTVRLLNGVLAPSGGGATVFGLDVATQGAAIRARTGVLTETPALDDRMSARATLRFFAEVYGVEKTQIDPRVNELLALFELQERADDRVGGFSKGMRQRMAIARTLIHRPQLVFLDEPTAALDPVATREVHQMIHRLAGEGHTVFLCTHNLVEAQTIELAHQLGRGERLRIEIERAQVAAAEGVLRALPFVTAVEHSLENGREAALSLHGVSRQHTPLVLQTLATAGINLFSAMADDASLEDVYFALQAEPSHGTPALVAEHTPAEVVR